MNILEATLLAGTPLLLAVLGELVVQRSGQINLGLEGMMLSAAFGATAAAAGSGSVAVGLAGGVFAAAIAGLIFGALTIARRADPIVTGVALNLLMIGATSVLYREWNEANRLTGSLPTLPRFAIGISVDPIVLVAWIAAPAAVAVLLWRTRAGLRLRATGENPDALRSGGISPARSRWVALGVETLLAGLAGGYLALGLASGFAENMTAGRGFIALSIVIFARWSVAGALAGVALFAAATALQFALQAGGFGVPFQLLLGLPYVVTLAILAAVPGRVEAPAALGKPV